MQVMKVADDKDYDDYNEYADYLAAFLSDKVELYGQAGWSKDPHQFFYELIQEFNRSLE